MKNLVLLCAVGLWLSACGEASNAPDDNSAVPAPDASSAEDRPLEKALREKRDGFMATAPDELKATFKQASDEIAASGVLERAKSVGGTAPEFELKDSAERPHALTKLRAEGPIVLAFYRGKW